MKKLFLILCLLAFTGSAYAAVDYNRTSSPLSVGETDKYFKDLNSWDSSNLYVPGQPYHQNYDYSYQHVSVPGQTTSTQPIRKEYRFTTPDGETATTTAESTTVQNPNQGANVKSSTTTTVTTRRRGGYRWGKSPNETHYNFGGTGFKSKGFGQGYTN